MLFDPPQNTEDVVPGWTIAEITELIKLGYFDNDFYLSMNPDVALSGVNPLMHYLQLGWREGRQPSAQVSYTVIDFFRHYKEDSRNPLNFLSQ